MHIRPIKVLTTKPGTEQAQIHRRIFNLNAFSGMLEAFLINYDFNNSETNKKTFITQENTFQKIHA